MVDTRDLKSLAYCKRVGSSPTFGTNMISGSSSVGRAQPCQGWGREFESRFPLNISETPDLWIGRCCFKSLKDNGLIFLAFSACLSNSSQSVQNSVQGGGSLMQRAPKIPLFTFLTQTINFFAQKWCDVFKVCPKNLNVILCK